METNTADIIDQVPLEQHKKKFDFSKYILIFIIFLLIIAQVWGFYKISKLEERVILAENQISALSTDTSYLSNRLDYVTPLAENGNRWAHSHNGW